MFLLPHRFWLPLFTFVGTAWAVAAGSVPIAEWQPPVPLTTLHAAKAALIPFPRDVKWGGADWQPTPGTTVVYPAQHAAALASAVEILQRAFAENGLTLDALAAAGPLPAGSNRIHLELHPGITPSAEGYQLTITADGVTLQAEDAAGAFYGAQTLRQMLRPDHDGLRVQLGAVRDWPAFRLRGFMHDVGRNFQAIASLKAQLDIFAAYKLNAFHWHLTDNPAWRIECHAYPQLNDPRFQTRDPGQIYTYAQIRDLIAYARARHITVIPELDMPGHSAYFERAFNFTMDSPEGREVLEKLIDEFCREIPAADRPYLHLGADEVHIDQPREFMDRMQAVVRRNGSQPMVWSPGLPGDDRTVRQLWRDNQVSDGTLKTHGSPRVDSEGGYINSIDPLLLVQRHFFHQPCGQPQGDDRALGGILCLWPDVRVADKENIFRHNAVWPGLLAFAESFWQGRPSPGGELPSLLPAGANAAVDLFCEFEDRLAIHRDRFFVGRPFPFVKSARIPWRVVGPFIRRADQSGDFAFPPERKIQDSYVSGSETLTWRDFRGGTVVLGSIRNDPAVFPERVIGTAYALTYLHADTAKIIHAWVGFETPERSTRKSGGIPGVGQWDAFGGTVLVNDIPVSAPSWQQPGSYRYLTHTYKDPANEIPYTDEEFYWTRGPAEIHLRAGWNKILLRVPCGYKKQNWSYAFVPVKYVAASARWIEDEGVEFSTEPRDVSDP